MSILKITLFSFACLFTIGSFAQGQPEFIEIEDGFSQPVGIVNAGDGSDRLFVVEREGVIRIIDNSTERNKLSDPFLDIRGIVNDFGGEEGLLGLAFHPDYKTNGYFYVNYIFDSTGNQDDQTRISRFSTLSDPNKADPNSELVLLDIPQPRNNHNAGDMHFGPDGYLYIATGDGGGGGDPFGNGQNLNTLLSCILRIDVDNQSGGNNYAIPPDNPFINTPSAGPEIWTYGLRNPWRISFDPANGDLYIADVGQVAREEVSIISAGQAGLNLGWPCREGFIAYSNAPANCGINYHEPIFDYVRTKGRSITGGHVYRGASFPNFTGWYFAMDYVTHRLFQYKSGQLVELQVPNIRSITSFGRSEAGEMYVASVKNGTGNNFNGTIYRLIDRAACPLTLNIPTVTSPRNTAEQSIISDAQIASGDQVYYGAPVVELLSGFCVPSLAQFEVDHKICGAH